MGAIRASIIEHYRHLYKRDQSQKSVTLVMHNIEFALGMDISAHDKLAPQFFDPKLQAIANRVAEYYGDMGTSQQAQALKSIQEILGMKYQDYEKQFKGGPQDLAAPPHKGFGSDPKNKQKRKEKYGKEHNDRGHKGRE